MLCSRPTSPVLLAQPEQEWLEQFVGLPETFLVKGMRGGEAVRAVQLINIIARSYMAKCPLSR